MKFFLYARKSTDVEDKQVMSIEAQLIELRALARRDDIEISEEFIEKQSAKKPGRPIFEVMLRKIEKGEAHGIICWKIDRLSRNPVDSGRVSWLLQQSVIQKIVTHDRNYLPQDNVLVMSVEFGMANEYIRQLSANTARGLRQKVRQGIYPGLAPIGYLNNPLQKSIEIDRKKAKLVKHAFEMYATQKYTLEDIARFFAKRGVISKGNKLVHISRVSFMLSNPFYCGLFRYAKELHQGTHTPIISKKLFDDVQVILHGRGRPLAIQNDPRPYCGLLKCATCGMSITGENKLKRQLCGTIHHYVYYRCTKKSKTIVCDEPCIRQEKLDAQLSSLLAQNTLSKEWADALSKMILEHEKDSKESASVSIASLRESSQELSRTAERLTDLYVAQDIERDDYLARRRELVLQRKTIEEKIARLSHDASAWLEPMRKWITEAQMLEGIANSKDNPSKKSSLQKIFGSNLSLHAREARGEPQNPWVFLHQAKSKIGQMETSLILEHCHGIEPRWFASLVRSVKRP